MSKSGSLMTFENNNEQQKQQVCKKQPQVQVKPVPPSRRDSSSCFRAHFNSLWSVWYGLCAAGLQAYIAEQSVQRLLGYAALPWPGPSPPPRLELYVYLALTGVAVLLIPFFLAAAVFKIGNLANDGFKLGRHLSTCGADPASSVVLGRSGVLRSLWQHGGPTAPFLHLVTSFCLLLLKLLVEARLIQTGFLHKDAIWRTDLDFMVVHRDRLVVLSFMTSPNQTNFLPTPLPFLTSSAVMPPSTIVNGTENVTASPSVSTAKSQALRSLQELVSSDLEADEWGGPVSAEFVNYALALLVYAVRYPAVFWNTNKGFAALFSLQLLANGLQSLLAFAGVCVLYKVQVVGAADALPPLPHHTQEPFLLNSHVTLALFVMSNMLILASSLVLYLYGYGRFNAFLRAERERRVVVLGGGGAGWGYFTHCAALCVLLALAVCNAPLLFDYTVLYRGSLDGAILATVVGAILHLFLWILLWLLLTIKQRWVFKLRVTVGRATVRSARSVKLVTDVDLISARHDASDSPLLVVGNGRTYTIADTSPKKAIMSVIQRAALERKAKAAAQAHGSGSTVPTEDNEEQIYWLRPKPPSPKTSPDAMSDRLTWLNRKLSGKPKVTFDDNHSSRKGKTLLGANKGNKMLDQLAESEEDDGDYATLREIPCDTVSEENKLLDSALRDDAITYARTNRDLTPGDYEDPSPLLTPEPCTDDLPPPPTPCDTPSTAPVTVTVHSSTAETQQPVTNTPRCLRRADSGMPHDELTPRSDSDSSGGSPPCHSETSSGVHSNSSSETPHKPRSTSADDLTEPSRQPPPAWRSFSLQRNVQPPPTVAESTVVIRRSKQARPKTTDEPFGRSTNMRMTSFTDHPAATLPLYPTQQVATVYPHCSTMPLPTGGPSIPRQHTTIPSHVRLFNPFVKRLHHCASGVVPSAGLSGGHHTFPHKYSPLQHKQDRDSANFSMASSGDSDQYLPHT
ncbi:protein tincar-like isoform X1 [Periplaneta americana]|uniref:protein tincar-like isoform X1 n=1 Tax=Periplaneta americana TaxID=6978 RepID=UPI0037E8DD72